MDVRLGGLENAGLTIEPRPLAKEEEGLLAILQPLSRGDRNALPDDCELEGGYFLRLILDVWASGGGRDGRKGHLTDSDIAGEIARRTNERFDRNRFQATFGVGKKGADGVPMPQPVARPVAKALLEIALKNWDAPPSDSEVKAPDATPFAQLDLKELDRAIKTALDAMYGDRDREREVRCRKVIGLGWNGLYRELGAEGFTVIVIARDDALRMRDPDEVFVLSHLLNRLLCQPRSRDVDERHIWAIRRPDRNLDRHTLVREFDGIGTLKSKLKTIEYLNRIAPKDWEQVDLDRCLIAEAATYSAHADLFDLGVTGASATGEHRVKEPIAVLAVSPDREVRFFTFSLDRAMPVAPFARRHDLTSTAKKQILALLDDSRTATSGAASSSHGDWHFHRSLDFANRWDWQIQEDKKR